MINAAALYNYSKSLKSYKRIKSNNYAAVKRKEEKKIKSKSLKGSRALL